MCALRNSLDSLRDLGANVVGISLDGRLKAMPRQRSVFILDESGKVIYRWVSDNPLVEPNYNEIKAALKKAKK